MTDILQQYSHGLIIVPISTSHSPKTKTSPSNIILEEVAMIWINYNYIYICMYVCI